MSNIRTVKPEAGNKYFNRKANGGYSTCIKGKPTDKGCDVLSNCVGYANGAFNEELDLGYEKYHLNCNAENFIERAVASGLSVVSYPVPGGIMVWQKGATLSGKDGAGHVCICTSTDHPTNPTVIKTAESGYGNKAFWTATRKKGTGSWGAGANYKFRGCIVNPKIGLPVVPEPTPEPTPEPKPEPTPTPTPTPVPTKIVAGDYVMVNGRGRASSAGTGATTRNYVNHKMKVIATRPNAKCPYALNQYAEGKVGDYSKVTGWFPENAVKKV